MVQRDVMRYVSMLAVSYSQGKFDRGNSRTFAGAVMVGLSGSVYVIITVPGGESVQVYTCHRRSCQDHHRR